MTVGFRARIACPHCAGTVNTEERWKAWIRHNPNLDSQIHGLFIGDSDLWVHKFGSRKSRVEGWNRDIQYLMMVEVKTFGKAVEAPQRDKLNAIDAVLRTKPWKEQRELGQLMPGHPQNVRRVHSLIAGKPVRLICHGVHVLRMDDETPGTSSWLLWDDRPISREQLEGLLRYDIDPDSLRLLEHREHKQIIPQPTLFTETEPQ